MLLTFVIIALTAAAGAAVTYVYEKDDSLLGRLAAGNVIGSAIFATIGFVLACLFGFSLPVVVAALFLTMAPLLIVKRREAARELRHDLDKAKGKTQGANLRKTLRFAYYASVLILLWFFFERAMVETEQGIFTGGSQNLGDLPFHLGVIFSFTEGNNFPPSNPSFAGAKFTYPFFADMLTAFYMKLGAGVREAMLVQNVFLGFSLVILLERFVARLTGIRKTGKIAALLLLFSGGMGFVWFFKDYWEGAQGIAELLWNLPRDYTIGEKFRWGNSLVALFLTQRSLLFGMPLTLIALTKLWDTFRHDHKPTEEPKRGKHVRKDGIDTSVEGPADGSPEKLPFAIFVVGLLAGMLPLIHVHSLAVLFIVCAFLFFVRFGCRRDWIAFGVGVSLVAVPELVWSLSGSASNLREFVGWHLGWDSKDDNFLFFWIKNLGLFIPLIAVGMYLLTRSAKGSDAERDGHGHDLALFYVPFAFLFLVSNVLKLAPWEWDNIKVLIYWYVGSLPFVAYALAFAWQKTGAWKALAAAGLTFLMLSGMLDVWRTVTSQINYSVFSTDAVRIAGQIKQKTPPGAMFLNAPTYNSAVVLSGRRSLMRYSGHLSSYGIDYAPREAEVKRIYEGSTLAESLLRKYGIEYVIISPEETANIAVREEFFGRYPVVSEIGEYKVVKVK